MSETHITLGNSTFTLDAKKAEEAFAAKSVINGKDTPFFNILPIKYQWAYDLYKRMKGNHWEPEDIPMQKDIAQWRSDSVTDAERWIIRMAIGYFSAAEGIVGDNILHVVRDRVTAPELKLYLGRHAHEENIHADSLVYMISSLGINPHECEAILEGIPSVKAKAEFVVSNTRHLKANQKLDTLKEKQDFARNIFLFGQVMEGTQFYGLFGMVFSLYRQNKFPGIGQMFAYTTKDESCHLEGFRHLLQDLVRENPEIWTPEFKEDLRSVMREGIALEKTFIADCLPVESVGMSKEEFCTYIDYVGDVRLESVGLEPLGDNSENPFPWLAEMMYLKKESNFFESRVTGYQKGSALAAVDDDEL